MRRSTTRIKIFGERNTGTNYLDKLIKINFKCIIVPGIEPNNLDKVFQRLPLTENLRDFYFSIFKYHNLGWKHKEIVLKEISTFTFINFKNIKLIFLIKNPYSWLISLWKNPYHNFDKHIYSFDEFIRSNWKTVKRESSRGYYINPIDMWNSKINSYQNTVTNYDSIFIKYEDLLINTISELERIQNKFKLIPRKNFFQNYTKTTKKQTEKNREYYCDYYGNGKWMKFLSKSHIGEINKYLDEDIMNKFNYKFL